MSVYLMSHALKTTAAVLTDAVKHEACFSGRKNKEHLLVFKTNQFHLKKSNLYFSLLPCVFNYCHRDSNILIYTVIFGLNIIDCAQTVW